MTQEISVADQLPKLWRKSDAGLWCARCSVKHEREADAFGDVIDEEVIYPKPGDDTLDDDFEDECEVCRGPCQGH
jgi:hypothetical protein